MKLVGNWTGISYYEDIQQYVAESTIRISVLAQDLQGNVSGILKEECEWPGFSMKPKREENVFRVRGRWDEEKGELELRGPCESEDNRMRECSLKVKMTGEDSMEGTFHNPRVSFDVQRVKLDRGDVRKDIEELMEMGRLFVERMRREEQEKKGRRKS